MKVVASLKMSIHLCIPRKNDILKHPISAVVSDDELADLEQPRHAYDIPMTTHF